MSTIKSSGGIAPATPLRSVEPTDETNETKKSQGTLLPDEAVKFTRNDTKAHRLYTQAQAQFETASAEKVQLYRQRIADGTYSPDMKKVAERMLAGISGRKDKA